MIGPRPTAPARRRPALVGLAISALAFALAQAGGVAKAQKGAIEFDAVDDLVNDGFELDSSMFHQWIFGSGNKIVSTPEHLESLLLLALEDVDRACSLSEAQRRKLLLAGHGDRKRFMDRVAEARGVFERLRHDPNGSAEIVQYTQPLAASFAAGLYGEGSFFAKTIGTTLSPEQASRHRETLLEKARFRYKAKVSLVLASLDARVGFTADQRRRYVALVLEETMPPTRPAGHFEESVVFLKIARLPEAKVRPIFDEPQWKQLKRIFQRVSAMEETLRANGVPD